MSDITDSDRQDHKEGTTIIGIVANDGIVLAADKQISGHTKKSGEKIFKIHPNCVIGAAGAVFQCQKMAEKCKKEVNKYEFKRGRYPSIDNTLDIVTELSRENNFSATLFAGYNSDGGYITEHHLYGSYNHTKDFDAVGSGEMIAKGSISEQYHSDITMNEAQSIAINALKTTYEHGLFTGIGIDVAKITSDGVTIEKSVEKL